MSNPRPSSVISQRRSSTPASNSWNSIPVKLSETIKIRIGVPIYFSPLDLRTKGDSVLFPISRLIQYLACNLSSFSIYLMHDSNAISLDRGQFWHFVKCLPRWFPRRVQLCIKRLRWSYWARYDLSEEPHFIRYDEHWDEVSTVRKSNRSGHGGRRLWAE